MNKRIEAIDDKYYFLDISKISQPRWVNKPIDTKKLAKEYLERRLKNDPNYIIVKGLFINEYQIRKSRKRIPISLRTKYNYPIPFESSKVKKVIRTRHRRHERRYNIPRTADEPGIKGPGFSIKRF